VKEGGAATTFRATTDITSLVDANKVLNVYAQWNYKAPLEPVKQENAPPAPADYGNIGTTGTFTVTIGEANEYTGVSGMVEVFNLGIDDEDVEDEGFGAGYWIAVTLIPATATSPRPIGVWVTPDNNDDPFDWAMPAGFTEITQIDAPAGKYFSETIVLYYNGDDNTFDGAADAKYKRITVGIKFPDDTEPNQDYDFILSAVKVKDAPDPDFVYTTTVASGQTCALTDNFQWGNGYQGTISGATLFNSTDATPKTGDVYEIEMEFTVSRDLEDRLEMCLVQTGQWSERTRFLDAGTGYEMGTTYTYSARFTLLGDTTRALCNLVFATKGAGTPGTGGTGVKGTVTMTFTKLNFSKVAPAPVVDP
jgi:hypothetical protein